jgi:sorbose reductase
VEIVVANSSKVEYGPAGDFAEEAYRKTLGVNFDGAFFTVQAAAKVFKRLVHQNVIRRGKIIFTASVSSLVVNFPQKQALYNASKAGVVQLA